MRCERAFPGCREQRGRQRLAMVVALALGVYCTTGCEQKGADRIDLKGKVSYGGQPVPKGYILFAPDRDKGNRGPGAKAGIDNGNYETIPGQGLVGGPHKVTINGYDGVPYKMEDGNMNPAGKLLFPPYETRVDFPKESGEYNFDVPAAKK